MNVPLWPLAGLFLAISVSAHAADAAAVYSKGGTNPAAMACATYLPRAEGEGMAAAGFPRLAGLSANYMRKQLADFASGARANPIMQPIAAALSHEEADAVSTMLADKPQPQVERIDRTALVDGPGETLALRGAWIAISLNASPVTAPAELASATLFHRWPGSRHSTCRLS